MELEAKDYPQLTNEILFNRYIGGDLKAFDAILARTKNLIYSLIMRYVHSRPEADEIFQEVFFKVCKNKKLFRESISFKSWLVTICRNACIDYTRKQKRSFKTESLDGNLDDGHRSLLESLPADEMTPADNLSIQLENENLSKLLDKLPAEQRDTFYLKVVMELTFEEISDSMKCSTNTAKSRYRYALEALRALVKRQSVFDKAV